jgi:quinol monooxygenase YgiN
MSQVARVIPLSLRLLMSSPDFTIPLRPQDETKFGIVERYEQESSQAYHLANPIWKLFDPYVIPLLAKPMELSRFEEF